jgi:hypothetical protein
LYHHNEFPGAAPGVYSAPIQPDVSTNAWAARAQHPIASLRMIVEKKPTDFGSGKFTSPSPNERTRNERRGKLRYGKEHHFFPGFNSLVVVV